MPAVVLFAAQVAPPAPAVKVGDHFGDWDLEYAAIGGWQALCCLSQTVVASVSNQAIARSSLVRSIKMDELSSSALVPLGLCIPSGIILTIDHDQDSESAHSDMHSIDCLASIPISTKCPETMKSGKALAVSYKFRGAEKSALLTGALTGLASGINAPELE